MSSAWFRSRAGLTTTALVALLTPALVAQPALGAPQTAPAASLEAPPAGTTAVSDLPFVSETNGWGPVERDQTVGGDQAGDGQPMVVGGTAYPKGLGTNSVSRVEVYLGGQCTTFSTWVGVDDEVGDDGTVTFSVLTDGLEVASTGTLRGSDAAKRIDAVVTGAQTLTLVVGDAGDGNAWDHGDWLAPTVTCTGVAPQIASVAPVPQVEVPLGTSSASAVEQLPATGTVVDEFDTERPVPLTWTLDGYDGSVPGSHTATATFDLPGSLRQADPAVPLTVSTTVAVAPGTVIVTASPSSVRAGAQVTVRAAGFRADEQVAADLDGVAVGTTTADGAGLAELRLTVPAAVRAGTHRLTLVGATSAWRGSADLVVLAAPVASSVALSTAKKVAAGKKLAVTVKVASPGASVGGAVTLRENGKEVASSQVGVSGVVTLTLPAHRKAGSYSLTAVYAGSAASQAATSGAVTLKVTRAKAKVTVKAAKKKVKPRSRVKVSVRVKTPSGVSPAGKVVVRDKGRKVVSVKVPRSGKKTVKVRISTKVGKHRLTVRYAGNANVASVSSATTVIVKG